MTIADIFKTSVRALKVNKGRTILTILGIVIGITAIILVMSLGQGAQNLILGQIQGLGSKTIAVIPGREPSGTSDVAQIFSDSLKERDLEALEKKANVPTLSKIMPIVFGAENASFGSEKYQLTIFGASPLITEIFDLAAEQGSFFTEDDVRNKADLIVIGSKAKKELFGDAPALGQKIKIKDKNFRVIGILPKKGQVSFFNFDEAAITPYTTAQQYIFGIKYFHRLVIEAESEEAISQTVSDVQATLRSNHRISDPSKDDFFIQTQEDLLSTVSVVTGALTMFLAAVAAISLIVGGIGIMNIMLVSVTERTREIGLRKALGAKNRDILVQFLFEAVILTSLGGAIGIFWGALLSFLGSQVISYFLGQSWPFVVSPLSVLLGFGVAALIGIVFGLYPASRASLLNPIEALRYE